MTGQSNKMAFDMGTFLFLFPSVSILQVMVQRHPKLGLWLREGNFNMKALVMATTFWYCYLQGTWACLVFYYSPVQPLLLWWASRVEGFPTLPPSATCPSWAPGAVVHTSTRRGGQPSTKFLLYLGAQSERCILKGIFFQRILCTSW